MRRSMKLSGMGLMMLVLALLWSAPTTAEPYYTVRDGQKCSTCHVNHIGGGKRTAYAQVYMQTRMTMDAGVEEGETSGGTPRLYHGYLNEFFSVGADLRTALIYRKDDGEGATSHFDKSKSSCAGCHGDYDGKRAEVYAQYEPVPGVVSLVAGQNLMPSTESREVYGLLERLPLESYVKVGTFRLPSGFNNTWDAPFVHGEVYGGSPLVPGWSALRGQGVEFGMEPGPLAVSVSITNPGDLTAVPTGKRLGVNAYALLDPLTVGMLYYDDPVAPDSSRVFMGTYLGVALGRITLLAQRDTLTEPGTGGASDIEQMALLGQVDFLLSRGQNIKLQYEAYDPDTAVDNNIRDRTSLIYEPFVTRYLQLRAGARMRNGPTATLGANGKDYFIEAHLMY